MARGGKRQGVPGKQYAQRGDMQMGPRKPSVPTVAPAATNPTRGAQAEQLRSLSALPLATQPPATTTAGVAVTGATPPNDGIAPGSLPPLTRPTERPGEPVTAGSPSGPGPGPTMMPTAPSTADDLLRSVAPTSPELAQLYSYLSRGGQ